LIAKGRRWKGQIKTLNNGDSMLLAVGLLVENGGGGGSSLKEGKPAEAPPTTTRITKEGKQRWQNERRI